MAPEVFRHEPYNSRVDVYSFSMIVYQLFEVRCGVVLGCKLHLAAPFLRQILQHSAPPHSSNHHLRGWTLWRRRVRRRCMSAAPTLWPSCSRIHRRRWGPHCLFYEGGVAALWLNTSRTLSGLHWSLSCCCSRAGLAWPAGAPAPAPLMPSK